MRLQKKYDVIRSSEVRFEETQTEDADYLIVAFGSAARISMKTIEMCRKEGIKIGMIRPITLWPFPSIKIGELSKKMKAIFSIEINAGQMVEDIRQIANGRVPVFFYGRQGGIIPSPEEVLEAYLKHI